MKLTKWLIDLKEPIDEENEDSIKDLHVIGTCGECDKWMQEDLPALDICNGTHKGFGCIHFEQKEGS